MEISFLLKGDYFFYYIYFYYIFFNILRIFKSEIIFENIVTDYHN